MENILYTIVPITLITIAFLTSYYKIIKNKNANGKSSHSYIISAFASLYVVLLTESNQVLYIYLGELILSIVGALLVVYFHIKTKYEYKEKKRDFIIPFIFSMFGILGISQTIKSFKSRKRKSQVSVIAYLLFAISYCMALINVETFYVALPIIISTILCLYISIQTFLTNQKYLN